MDKWVPTICMILAAVLASAAYFLWDAQMSNASDNIITEAQAEETTAEFQEYQKPQVEKTRILIVPGHDGENYGADYRGLTEQEITLELAENIRGQFSQEEKFEVFMTRDSENYTEQFTNYFIEQKNEIVKFISDQKGQTENLIETGQYEPIIPVEHNDVTEDVSIKLYGINKWVNENDIDLVVHLHFNDYPRKNRRIEGKYNGFSIYIPSDNLVGNEKSKILGEAIRQNLLNNFKESNLPVEKDIVIENSELIAVGANNTINSANSVLIEYGYIYEEKFFNEEKRSETLEKAAIETYLAIKNLF